MKIRDFIFSLITSTIIFSLSPQLSGIDLDLFKSSRYLNPIRLNSNPYALKHLPNLEQKALQSKNLFSGVHFSSDQSSYKLRSFGHLDDLLAEDYQVTHKGACGMCSSLQDLAVYLENPDLTRPVRRCATLSMFPKKCKNCLKKIGFSQGCADIWFYNILNTRKHCFATCAKSWLMNEPFNLPNGSLNKCLQCDESESGDVLRHMDWN